MEVGKTSETGYNTGKQPVPVTGIARTANDAVSKAPSQRGGLLKGVPVLEAIITIKGGWADMYGGPMSALMECLSFDDPDRHNNAAFKDGRWDGKRPLYTGRSFPAGLCGRVSDHLKSLGYNVRIVWPNPLKGLKLTRFGRDYLPGIKLRGHQYDACLTLFTNPRCSLRIPTAGGKTEVYIAAARYLWEEKGWKSLILLGKRGLCDQTVKRCMKYYGSDIPVGQIGDGVRTFGTVNVGTAASLIAFKPRVIGDKLKLGDPELEEFLKTIDVLFIDEAHHTKAKTWWDVAMACGAKVRYGGSGTPLTGEELPDAMLVGATGPVLFEADATDLIEQGLASKPKIAMVMAENASEPNLGFTWGTRYESMTQMVVPCKVYPNYDEAYRRGIVESDRHNETVIRCAKWFVARNRPTVILTRKKAHFRKLKDMLQATGLRYRAIWGDTSTFARNAAKDALTNRSIDVLLATTILDEGEDVPVIGAMIFAEGVKSYVNAVQRVGRGMRVSGAGDVWIVDIVSLCAEVLVSHASQRAEAWERQGYEVRLVTDWPKPGQPSPKNLLPFENWDKVALVG